MKIGFIIGHPTQFEGPFFQYAAHDSRHRVHVIYLQAADDRRVVDPELPQPVSWGIDLLSGYQYSVLPHRGRLRSLDAILRDGGYDFLIISGYNRPEFAVAACYGWLRHIPQALRLDTVLFMQTSRRKLLIKRLLFRILSHVYRHFFAIGSHTSDYLQCMGIPERRISYFSYSIDKQYFHEKSRLDTETKAALRSRYGISDRAKVVISVAKFNDREAPWDLLMAAQSLRRDDVHLLLVGDGEQRCDLEGFVRSSVRVPATFAGYVPYPELAAHYAIADVFVHPARREPWGVSVAEAMACGLPVIASSMVGAARDLIRVGQNGYTYPHGDVPALRDRILGSLDTLHSEQVRIVNDAVLEQWDYNRTWSSILEVASRYSQCGHER